MHTDRKEPG